MIERICPVCGRDYGPLDDYPDDTCMVCDVPLRAATQAKHPQYLDDVLSRDLPWPKDEEAIQVYIARDFMEGQIIKSLLESAQIPVYLRSDSVGHVYGLTSVGFTSPVSVSVPYSRAADARSVIQDSDSQTDRHLL